MNQLWFVKIFSIFFRTPYNLQHKNAVESFSRTVQNFLTLVKDHQKDDYSLDDSIYNFVLYYNDRFHSATEVAPYKTMMNASDMEIMREIWRKNI